MSIELQFTVKQYSPSFSSELIGLNKKYHRRYPKANLVDENMLRSPIFKDGENLICALDCENKIAGYVPLSPHLAQNTSTPNLIWANMVIDPTYIRNQRLRDILLEYAIIRAKEITSSAPRHSTKLWFQHHVSEIETIEYVVSKGATYGDSVLRMVRDLSGDIEIIPAPQTIEIRYWNMETEAELTTYLVARNEAFPQMPITLEDWRHFIYSVVGNNGTTVAAFEGEKLVGAVSTYWLEEENQRLGEAAGWTENVFIIDPWRGKGIADSMISMACVYLKERGIKKAQLDTGVSNQKAVHVYKRLGYEIVDESLQYWFGL